MKSPIVAFSLIFCFAFQNEPACGDGTVYANKKQTESDKRFDAFPKIEGIPSYKGGDKKLESFVRSKLTLAKEAQNMYFRLNYRFTVTCEGKIKDVKQLGDARIDDMTNLKDVIPLTEGSWKPAKKDGKPVDCVYSQAISIRPTD